MGKKRLSLSAGAVLTTALGISILFHESSSRAADPVTPINDNRIAALTALDEAVEAVAAHVQPAVVNIQVTSRGSDDDQMQIQGQGQGQGQLPPGFERFFGPNGPFGGFGLENLFKQEFAFDPSTRADEVEGSIPQALMLMNNPAINQRIRATGNTVLSRILSTYSTDDEALRAVYLKALARRPTDRELERCRTHIRQVNNRTDAFEDILWVLINSEEFVFNH